MFWQMNSISFLSIRDMSTDKRASVRACVRRRGSCKKGGPVYYVRNRMGWGELVHLITYYSRIQWPER